ncbi:DUF3473 domain-containing protein [candidate division KSB1 bacterium]|nr:DUF3473 domain-containing protein [candidate division KSB1 bacterium]
MRTVKYLNLPADINALTINADDWYQVDNLRKYIKFEDWHNCESRFEINIQKILQLLNQTNTKATFFIMGWEAAKSPEIIQQILNDGHEIATQGYQNRFLHELSRDQFEDDLKKAIDIIENITNEKVIGYRAPHFSVSENTTWIWAILSKLGIKYDSSIFPVKHIRYGYPDAPRFPFHIAMNGSGELIEYPLSTYKLFKANIPIAGGGYLRLFPYRFIHNSLKKINKSGKPVNIYFHPWEMDRYQPHVKLDILSSFRHYTNIKDTENKVRNLLNEFKFAPIKKILGLED